MSRTPTPPPFDSRALGELVLARLAEIEHLNSPQRRQEVAGRHWEYTADRERAAELSQSLDLYARLADTAARAEHNDVLAAQQAASRRREAADEY